MHWPRQLYFLGVFVFLGTKTLNVGLRVTIDDGVLISELNRPKRFNASYKLLAFGTS